jgi:hypothetical protein
MIKNQRPPAEMAWALPGAILIPPALLVVADFGRYKLIDVFLQVALFPENLFI